MPNQTKQRIINNWWFKTKVCGQAENPVNQGGYECWLRLRSANAFLLTWYFNSAKEKSFHKIKHSKYES